MMNEEQQPLVSVVIPTYNRASLIPETLQSLQAQTYPHWEAIVVDDGSTDDTDDVMAAFTNEDGRIRYQKRTGEKKGAPVCRNQGMDAAQGKYLIFLDSDDMLHPKCLEGRQWVMECNPELDFVAYPAEIFSEKPGDMGVLWNVFTTEPDGYRFLRYDVPWDTTGPIWRTKSLQKYSHKWDESALSSQDREFHAKALLNNMKYAKVNIPDHYVRRNEKIVNAISNNDKSLEHIHCEVLIFLNLACMLSDSNMLDSFNVNLLAGMINRKLRSNLCSLEYRIKTLRRAYSNNLLSGVRYIESVVAYTFFSVKLTKSFARRYMDMRWLEHKSINKGGVSRVCCVTDYCYFAKVTNKDYIGIWKGKLF